ncbi:fluoride efflux transporter CrcB [Longimicrobium sp.]|uniref:fluoride efflux transporter CrcB n=1 Tax=Longimicrobium sp. TaxID=2029185 RepID=UPI003B3B9A8D
MPWLYVALGGAVGSVLRYGAGQALGPARPGAFPWHTFAVNVAGALLLGLIVALVPRDDPHHLRALLAVGFCGGLTTFSTFGYETVSLLQSRAYAVALAYAGASFLVALLAVVTGMWSGARLAH